MKGKALSILALSLGLAASAQATVQITEFMYNGAGGAAREFVEFTNLGPGTVDMTNWSFDDSSRAPGSQSLGSFGTLAEGESAILCEPTADAFRTAWGLSASVKIVGGNTNNLSRSDEINLYDGTTLIDRLTYDDQTLGGTRTQGVSANPPMADPSNGVSGQWIASVNGDAYGSHLSTDSEIGNPGVWTPEPSSIALLMIGGFVVARRRRN
jgi:predicted extracellular nuclease